MKYINTYNTDAEYYNDNDKLFPNVSYVKDIDEVKWRRRNSNLIVTKFLAKDPNQSIDLTQRPELFDEIAVEGVPQTLRPNVTVQYTFATPGEHEVTYKFVDSTEIGDHAFGSCGWMTSINIPSTLSITSIGQYAFSSCYHLTSFEIPNSVTTIGEYAFRGCLGLTAITIPDSVTSIGDGTFSNCTGLTSFEIPYSVTSIGNSAFSGCSGLTNITIPNSATSIGQSAFWYCTGLTSITSLNTTPPTLGTDVFFNVPATCTIYVPAASVNAYKAASGWSDRAAYIQPIQ